MDIMEIVKDKVEEIVEKIKKDSKLADKFQKDPIATVESLLDVDLPNEQLEPLVEGIKASRPSWTWTSWVICWAAWASCLVSKHY